MQRMTSSKMMDLSNLPYDYIYRVMSLLSIEERIMFCSMHPALKNNTKQMYGVIKKTKSLIIRSLQEEKLQLNGDTSMIASEYHLYDRWHCRMLNHPLTECFGSNESVVKTCDRCGDLMVLCILRKCPEVEALDLRGVVLTKHLVEGIIEFGPKIFCLWLNFARFDSKETLDLYVQQMAPRIKYLSCDNELIQDIENGFSSFFSSSINLILLEVILFPNGNLLPIAFANLPQSLEYFSPRFYRSKYNSFTTLYQHMAALSEGNAKNISNLKVRSNYSEGTNFNLFQAIKSLRKLRALNLGFKMRWEYKYSSNWPELISLTLDLYCQAGAHKVTAAILDGLCNLQHLRLYDHFISKPTLIKYARMCPKLECLTLVDMTVRKANIFDGLKHFQKLKSVRFEFSRDDAKASSVEDFVRLYKFPDDFFPKMINFIRKKNDSFEMFEFIDSPGLSYANLKREGVTAAAEANGVQLFLNEFEPALEL